MRVWADFVVGPLFLSHITCGDYDLKMGKSYSGSVEKMGRCILSLRLTH